LINMTKRVLNKLFISSVIHEALVEVNETGTAASAATVIHTDFCAVGVLKQTNPVIFKANHHFIYFIIHKPSRTIVFYGDFAGA